MPSLTSKAASASYPRAADAPLYANGLRLIPNQAFKGKVRIPRIVLGFQYEFLGIPKKQQELP